MVTKALLLHLTVLQEVRGVLVLSCSDYVDMQDTIIHICLFCYFGTTLNLVFDTQ